MKKSSSPLPYTDTKSVGAADFYFAINATFRFILKRFGMKGLRAYWTDLGTGYFAPVSEQWKDLGLKGVAAYWQSFFRAEPGSKTKVRVSNDTVTVEVAVCPAIKHLRKDHRKIVRCFCQHCYFVSEAMAAPAGLTVRIHGGNGKCRQTFHLQNADVPKQNLADIKEVLC